MTPAELDRWWRDTFRLAQGGVAVIPHVSVSREEVRAFYRAYAAQEAANDLAVKMGKLALFEEKGIGQWKPGIPPNV